MDIHNKNGLEAIARLAERLDDEPEHPRQVRRLAVMLFDETQQLHALEPPQRRLLEAAALLHDIGYQVSVEKHHKHARDLILQQELPGFDEEERRMIACIARYHRKALPRPDHKVYCDLHEEAQRHVRLLAGLLRVADGLDRSHQASVRGLSAGIENGALTIRVQQAFPSARDIWGAGRKSELLAQELGMEVQVTRAGARAV